MIFFLVLQIEIILNLSLQIHILFFNKKLDPNLDLKQESRPEGSKKNILYFFLQTEASDSLFYQVYGFRYILYDHEGLSILWRD